MEPEIPNSPVTKGESEVMVTVQGAAGCVTGKVIPAIVIVPARSEAVPLAPTENCKFCEPDPFGLGIVIHGVDVDAFQAQPEADKTPTALEAPIAGITAEGDCSE